jgi:hypothetical protein
LSRLPTLHHQRKPPFSPSPSSHPFLGYFTHTPTSFIDLQSISLPSSNYPNTSFNPFYQNQESMVSVVNPPMQYNYHIIDNMFLFGSEGSSSSDENCTLSYSKEITQEEIGYHHHMNSGGFNGYNDNNFMIN